MNTPSRRSAPSTSLTCWAITHRQPRPGSLAMSEHTYTMIELVGSAHGTIEDAVQNAVAKAARDHKNLRWLEVQEIRGHIEDGKVAHWQARVKIGATLDG